MQILRVWYGFRVMYSLEGKAVTLTFRTAQILFFRL